MTACNKMMRHIPKLEFAHKISVDFVVAYHCVLKLCSNGEIMPVSRQMQTRLTALIAAALILIAPSVARADSDASTVGSAAPSASSAPGNGGGAANQPTPAEMKALIKESQNPVGNIAVFPMQNNFNYAAGPNKLSLYNLNLQPVVPIMLSQKMNLIERAIVPILNQPPAFPPADCPEHFLATYPCGSQLGIGAIQLQSYFAPKTKPNALIWGAGPIFSFPTVTKYFGSNQVGAGVNAVGLVMPGPWVIGMLVNQQWRIAGPTQQPPTGVCTGCLDEGDTQSGEASESTSINSFLAQPFINFNFGKGWALSEAPVITANWNKPGDQKWTVPLGLAVIQTNTWFKLPMSFQLAYYGNIVRPQFAPYGQIRFQWALIWPVKRGR
jgi:hypothetical protein